MVGAWPQSSLRPGLGIGNGGVVSGYLDSTLFPAAGGGESGAVVGELLAGLAHTRLVVADFLTVLHDLVFAGAAADIAAQLSPIIFQLRLLIAQLVAAVANLFSCVVDSLVIFAGRWLVLAAAVVKPGNLSAVAVRRNRRGSARIMEMAWRAVMVVPVAVRGAAANPMGVMPLMLGIGIAVVVMFALTIGGSVVAPIMFVPTLVFAMVVLVVMLIDVCPNLYVCQDDP